MGCRKDSSQMIRFVMKETLLEVNSKIKTGEGNSSIKPLQNCRHSLIGKV